MSKFINSNCPNYDFGDTAPTVYGAYCRKGGTCKCIEDVDCASCYFSDVSRPAMTFTVKVSKQILQDIQCTKRSCIITDIVDDYRVQDILRIECNDKSIKDTVVVTIDYVSHNESNLPRNSLLICFTRNNA